MFPRFLAFLFCCAVPGVCTADDGGSARLLKLVPSLPDAPAAAVPAEKDMGGYLMVYFKDETHSLYFATSEDGYSFSDVNGGEPVFSGRGLASQKGVRDPHITRGPDNCFYLVMTDLHIFARQAGLRETEWERPGEQYAWGNNQALIFMKSRDLLHWTHHIVRPGRLFPEFGDIGCAWAPQTIYDKKARRMMVYYSTRIGNQPNFMVYSHADPAFTTLSSAPEKLFTYPKAGKSTIDGDITWADGKFHLFYVAHDHPGGLRHAASERINSGYVFEPEKVDPESVACEAPNLWKRHGTGTYVLMYDVFGARPNNMGFSETTDFVNYRNIGRFNEAGSPMKSVNFSGPKHGAVISITAPELKRLNGYFKPESAAVSG